MFAGGGANVYSQMIFLPNGFSTLFSKLRDFKFTLNVEQKIKLDMKRAPKMP